MSSIDLLFKNLRQQNRKAMMPFITAGDPNLAFTAAMLRELAARGCHMAELGIPYSDPIADGPVIQESYTRAFKNGIRVPEILSAVKGVACEIEMPIVTMLSYAIIYRIGLEKYVTQAKAAGVAGAIVPDLPSEEAGPLAKICAREDFSLIQLVTPTTPRERAVRIANTSSGFLYYVSVAGITGERTTLPASLTDNVAWLREQTDLPVCIGFGISQPEHIKTLAPVADGLIVGSAIVRRMADATTRPEAEVVTEIGEYVSQMLEALNG